MPFAAVRSAAAGHRRSDLSLFRALESETGIGNDAAVAILEVQPELGADCHVEHQFYLHGPDSVSMGLPGGRVTLRADGIEALIVQLAQFRAKMKREVARTLADGEHKGGIVDPFWALPSHPAAQEKIFFVRHPGFGWLAFFFPPHEAKKLEAGFLAGQSPQTVGRQTPSGPHH
jgi:hypothetical protein